MRKILFVFLFVCGFASCAFATSTFEVTTTNMSAGTTFSFQISAAGNFVINWGDVDCTETKTDANGVPCIQIINKTNTTNTTYSYKYATAGVRTIGLSGKATDYTLNTYSWNAREAAISFEANQYVGEIFGSLGEIFSTLDNGLNPSFLFTFNNCRNLSGSIPQNLFNKVHGKAVAGMFNSLFSSDTKLTGEIPSSLFSGITELDGPKVFQSTFYGCSGLTGPITSNLFANLKGSTKRLDFNGTFANTGISGGIPPDLFAGITSAGESSFRGTFTNCKKLTGFIPAELFSKINGTAHDDNGDAYDNIFVGCTGMDTECQPVVSEPAQTTGYNYSKMNGIAVCKCVGDNVLTPRGKCANACPNDITKYLRVGSNIKIPLYNAQQTKPSLVIEHNNIQCFANLDEGETPNSLIIQIGDKKYHATN